MAELSIVPMAVCEDSYYGRSFNIGGYRQEVAFRGAEDYCSCKGFHFRKKCKHLDEAYKLMCTYHEQVDGPPNGDKCPKCGGPIKYVSVGV